MKRSTPSDGIFSRTVLSTAGMAAQGLARFLYTLAIGRLAGPEALGETSALLSIAVYLSLVLPAGLGIAASRYLPSSALAGAAAGYLHRLFWASSLGLAVVAAPIAYIITEDIFAAASCAALVFSYNAYVYSRGILMGEDRILRATIADFVSSLVALTALVAVLVAGVDWALLLPLATGYAIFAISARPRTIAGTIDAHERSMMRKFIRDATIGALATGGLLPATMVFVRAYDSPAQAGLFAAALSLATPASLISQAVNQVLIPHFSRQQGDPIQLQSSLRKIFAVTAALFVLIFGALVLLAPAILTILYGERFSGGTSAMQVLLVVVFLISATCAPSAYLMASGHQRKYAQIWIIFFVLGTVTMIVASPSMGLWGALIGFAVGGGGGSIVVMLVGLTVREHVGLPARLPDPQEKLS
ncbi:MULTISPECIES: lipopolysaccharide biosynthesis protein [unclassified Leucobacter]|uniref:lipopolysaccharide biosynthesis protein n=1 Tax=unclassified Leucobacter TaxID=2621730 RepID=UPI00165E97A7|nr:MULTISPECIES: lipopolysaccharide biosynthesis protein [unclassified Leucobacter]MBC9936613.1 lipopolysaccharide biosynthesis protein [Leucobacter sp. cx-87]